MPRNGLSKEKVIKAALIEQTGAADFSMRALADSLNVKIVSLCNHAASMDALMAGVWPMRCKCSAARKWPQSKEKPERKRSRRSPERIAGLQKSIASCIA